MVARLPESRPCTITSDPEHASVRKLFGQDQAPCFETAGAPIGISQIVRLPRVSRVLGIYFLIMLGFNFFYISFPVHAVLHLNWSVVDTGLFFAVMSLCMAVVQGPVLRRASRRWSDADLIVVGSVVLAASFVLFVLDSKSGIYAGAAVLALGNGLMWPSVLSVLSKAAGQTHQGAVQGFASSSGSIASIIGLVVGGLLYGTLGSRVFLISAATTCLAFVLALPLRHGAPEPQQD